MLKHKSKRVVSTLATLTMAGVCLGCSSAGISNTAAIPACTSADSTNVRDVPLATGRDLAAPADAGQQTSVEARHFDIYKHYHALSDNLGGEQVSGGDSAGGRGKAGAPTLTGGAAANACSFRALIISD